jgi:hypothetical protein
MPVRHSGRIKGERVGPSIREIPVSKLPPADDEKRSVEIHHVVRGIPVWHQGGAARRNHHPGIALGNTNLGDRGPVLVSLEYESYSRLGANVQQFSCVGKSVGPVRGAANDRENRVMEKEDFRPAGKAGRLILEPITRFPGNGPRPGGQGMHRVEAEKDRPPVLLNVTDSVHLSEKAPVASHREPREHPFQDGRGADLPVSGHADEPDPQRIKKGFGCLELGNESSVGYISGEDNEVRSLRENILRQGLKSLGEDLTAEMEVRKVQESHSGQDKRWKEQSQPVRQCEKVP